MKGKEAEYVIPLGTVYHKPRTKRPRKALTMIRRFVAKHARSRNVAISNEVNQILWANSRNVPRKMAIVLAEHEGRIYVYAKGGKQLEEDRKRRAEAAKAKRTKAEKVKGEESAGKKEAEAEAAEKLEEKREKESAGERMAIKRKTNKG